MGIFIKTTKHKDHICLENRKYSSSFWNFPLAFVAVAFLIVYFFGGFAAVAVSFVFLIFILCILGAWVGLEGIYYGFVKPLYYKKKGRKVTRELGKGIKIYN
ncbi:MAG: hypothetical protein ABH864_03035 [archaeon]